MRILDNILEAGGATKYQPLPLTDFPTGGSIGTAPNTVDNYTYIEVSQTTAGQTLTVPTPTNTTFGSQIVIKNTGSTPFTISGANIPVGGSLVMFSNGLAWTGTVPDSSSAVLSFSGGTTGLTPNTASVGTVTLAGTLGSANGGTGVTTSTGTGNNVLSTSPTLVTPILGTPTSVTLTNATGLPLATGVTGVLPIANGGTNGTVAAVNGGAVYSTATAYGITAAGTSGQVLTSNGAAAPTWQTGVSWNQGGNAVASQQTLGTTSNFALPIITNNLTRFTVASGTATLSGTGNTVITTDTTSALTVQSFDTGALLLDTGTTGSILVGTSATAKTITIGNITGSTSVNTKVGAGGYFVDGVGVSSYLIGASTITGSITIGGTAQTGNLILGQSTGTMTTSIANTTGGAQTINIGNGTSGNVLQIGNGANTVAQFISIGGGNSASNNTISIGTGTSTAGNKLIFIGSIDGFTTTKIIGPETRSVLPVSATGNVGLGTRFEMATGTITRTLPAPTASGRIISIKNSSTGVISVNVAGGTSIDTGTSFATATDTLNSATSQDYLDSIGSLWVRI